MSQKNNDNSVAMQKKRIQERLQQNREKICSESATLLAPIEKLRTLKQRFSKGSTPLLVVAGATVAGLFLSRSRSSGKVSNALPILKIAASTLPLFIKASYAKSKEK